MSTRCVALKNPCAIRKGSNWKGLSPFQHDREFCEFTDIVFGIRAFFVLMRTYHYKYKCNSIGDIFKRYAPITENNTPAYIAFVCKFLRESSIKDLHKYPFSMDDSMVITYPFVFDDSKVINTWFNNKSPCYWLRLLCKAVCKLESQYDCSDALIDEAIKLL